LNEPATGGLQDIIDRRRDWPALVRADQDGVADSIRQQCAITTERAAKRSWVQQAGFKFSGKSFKQNRVVPPQPLSLRRGAKLVIAASRAVLDRNELCVAVHFEILARIHFEKISSS